MKSFSLILTALFFLFINTTYACDAHHDTNSHAPKQTITSKHHTKIQHTAAKKAAAIKTQQSLNQNTKIANKSKV